jgi:hypothetical protein
MKCEAGRGTARRSFMGQQSFFVYPPGDARFASHRGLNSDVALLLTCAKRDEVVFWSPSLRFTIRRDPFLSEDILAA